MLAEALNHFLQVSEGEIMPNYQWITAPVANADKEVYTGASLT
jgi:hypothetical protein